MAKISGGNRTQYLEKIKPYRERAEEILKQEKIRALSARQIETGSGMTRYALSEDMLNLASVYIIQNAMSLSMLNTKNEDALNDARKSLYKSVIYMEEIITNLVDAPYSEYETQLQALSSLSAAERFRFVRKMGLSIDLLKNAYGDNTKWRWAFVELEGRYAAISKNIIDLKKASVNTNPESSEYEPTMYHLQLMQRLLLQSAGRYRERYELSTNRVDDFLMGINFLRALRRIYMLLGDRDGTEEIKKRIDIWTAKLELDSRKKDEADPGR